VKKGKRFLEDFESVWTRQNDLFAGSLDQTSAHSVFPFFFTKKSGLIESA
jgi:hypothetical protein